MLIDEEKYGSKFIEEALEEENKAKFRAQVMHGFRKKRLSNLQVSIPHEHGASWIV